MNELIEAHLHHHVIVDTDVINKAKWVEFLKEPEATENGNEAEQS